MSRTVRDQHGRSWGPKKGLEGPFKYKTGVVLYYDPRESGGMYFDPSRDMYIDYKEFAQLSGEVPVRPGRVASMWLRANMIDDWQHRGSEDDEDDEGGKTASSDIEMWSASQDMAEAVRWASKAEKMLAGDDPGDLKEVWRYIKNAVGMTASTVERLGEVATAREMYQLQRKLP